ncbi:RNA polymerase sigma factor RpoE [Sapientia aquatica]|uniref:RNA polymerase sigma factor n=1 Tax=Sapientia aquatica TaxID=1549640 RepID=A0A4R5W622_9BURK|nr:RNA polymerase sigma factor RpoE [Sapientia aquatica]TDK68400.1 RNA polymerase sigma factor RpoE [Sapientia aquatica]
MTTERDIDQLLVESVQNGDKRAFELLVLKYQRKLMRLVLYFVKNQAEAEDIVQDTFIKAYRALPNFRGESAFYTWLYRIGVNSAKNHLVAQRRRVPTLSDTDAQEAESFKEAGGLREATTPESILASKQLAETVNAAMNGLPEDLRITISLREIDGLSYEEIAEMMECPIGTVRSRIFRARETIANKIRPLLGTATDKRW